MKKPTSSSGKTSLDEAAVVTKAVQRVADSLLISSSELARVLGVSPSTLSRAGKSNPLKSPKAIELSINLIRVYRSLVGILEKDTAAAAWMARHNNALGGVPKELVESVNGLHATMRYLDAMRAKI